MKMIVLASLLIASVSFAQSADLNENMRAIGQTFRSVVGAMRGGELADVRGDVQELQMLVVEAKGFVPETVVGLTGDLRDQALLSYKDLMTQLESKAYQLESAIIADDRATFGSVLREMNQLRSEGHGIFNPRN